MARERWRRAGMAALVAAVLGLAPGRARGDDPEPGAAAARRWSVHVSTGLLYDSNVTIGPDGQVPIGPAGQPTPTTVEAEADGAISVGAGGSFDVVETDRAQVRLEYDLYQTLHFSPNLQDYNLRFNRVRGTAGYALLPELWAGVEAGYQHYALGASGYSGEPFVTPFVSLIESRWGLTQLLYRHGEITYLSEPFEGARDGPTDAVSLSQTIYWGPRTGTIGYEFGRERPRSSAGADYRYRYQQVYAGIAFSPGWKTSVDLGYLFRYEDYTEPNSFAPEPDTRRRDHINQVYATIQRPIVWHLAAAVSYYGTFDNSNIDVFTYDRHMVTAELRFAY